MKEFNLSEKEKYLGTGRNEDDFIFKKKDVKEFIKRLKEEFETDYDGDLNPILLLNKIIDKFAGDKLI